MDTLIKKVEHLKEDYDQQTLLKAAEEYNRILNQDDIDSTLYYESIDESLTDLKKGEGNIGSMLSDAAMLMGDYEKLSNIVKDHKTTEQERRTAKTFVIFPLFILQVVFIAKHKKYKGSLATFAGKGYNKLFVSAVGGMNK